MFPSVILIVLVTNITFVYLVTTRPTVLASLLTSTTSYSTSVLVVLLETRSTRFGLMGCQFITKLISDG